MPRRKYSGKKPVMGSRTFATMKKAVIVKRLNPETGEEEVIRVETAQKPKRRPRLDKQIE